MTVVALIPARGGSKGIPDKNISMCAGKPLIAYTAKSARMVESIDRVIVSTDSHSIAQVALSLGLEVPFIRPSHLATDTAHSLPVVDHALNWLEAERVDVEAIVLLQPTSPCRNSIHIEEAITLFRTTKADTIVSVVRVPHRYHPDRLLKISNGELYPFSMGMDFRIPPRQDVEPIYARNGPSIIVISPQQIRTGNFYSGRTVPYVMSSLFSLDIDTPEDLRIAELTLTGDGTQLF